MKLRDIGIGKRAERDGPNGTEIVEITGVGTRTYYVPVGVNAPAGTPGIVEQEDRDDWRPYSGPVSRD